MKSAFVDFEGRGVISRFSVSSSSESKISCCGGTWTGRSSVWGTGRIADEILGNWQSYFFVCNFVPKCWTYTKIGVTTQQTSLLAVWERSAATCIPSKVTILRIKPRFMYHNKYCQEMNSKAIFGSSTLNCRGISCLVYSFIFVLTSVIFRHYCNNTTYCYIIVE